MTLAQFMFYLNYNNIVYPPKRVSETRWRGMLKWHRTRIQLGEPFEYPSYRHNGELRVTP